MHAPVVAVVGGGQLARMMQEAAIGLGIELRALVEAADGATGQVVVDSPVGSPADLATMRGLVEGAEVLTFEHEHIPQPILAELSGVPIRPAPKALLYAQDKLAMRRRLSELGVPCPRWRAVSESSQVIEFLAKGPVIAKTPVGGYDGHGVREIDAPDQIADWLADGEVLLEEKVAFERELAVLLARRPSGEIRLWPISQTVQRDGMCWQVIAPAPELDPQLAQQIEAAARTVASELDVTGVLAIELFQLRDSEGQRSFVVNELAMRPHNSGHWTIDGAHTSQFEQHLRAVLDLPLGPTEAREPWTVMVNVLGGEHSDLPAGLADLFAGDPGIKVQLYGKEPRPGRKLGHVTAVGADLADVLTRAERAAQVLRGGSSLEAGTQAKSREDQ